MTVQRSFLRRLSAAILVLLPLGAAAAQQDNWLTRLFQPPASNAVPSSADPVGASGWSAQSGVSGHPLMTADAIRAAAADFNNCLERLWSQAAARGISRGSFERFTAGLTP